jgi:DNA-binding MarR family transcriptional regulator
MKKASDAKDIKKGKKMIQKEIIDNILNYLTKGIFPNNKPESFMNAYTIVSGLCDMGDKQAKELLEYHKQTIQNYIFDCKKILKNQSANTLIDEFLVYTEKINTLIQWMCKIFSYIDMHYNKKEKQTLPKISMDLYKSAFFEDFKNDIFIEVNKLIKDDRNGNTESRPKIKRVLRILKDLDLEKPKIMKENNKISWVGDNNTGEKSKPDVQDLWFNDYFSKDTWSFAEAKANNDIRSMSAPEYVESQLKYLDEEQERKSEYINPIYHQRIDALNHLYLIGKVQKELSEMDTGVKNMLETKKETQLTNLYNLFVLYPESLQQISVIFDPYIRNRGKILYDNKELAKDPKKFIPELISLKKEMDILVEKCFSNDPLFQDVKNKSFSLFMKKDYYAKQLSNYIDHCMRIGFKGKSPEEIENTLNDIISLFKCLSSKLVFQTESNKKMSERLIKKVSLSNLAEQSFISKLKQEQGVTYVNKMQEMMSDLEKNKKETESYKSLSHKGMPNNIRLDITVVSQSAWEISNKNMEKIELPKFLETCLNDFERFYINKHQGQKLIWCLGLSKVEIQYLYLHSKNISISTLPQLLSLLILEQNGQQTLGEIAGRLGCSVDTVITDIHGLVYNPNFNPQGDPNKGIIVGTFNAQTKEFKESDTIEINKNFVISKIKFNTLPLPQKKTQEQVKLQEVEEAKIIRKYQENIIQATVTRIMKSRIGQPTSHVWLVGETSKQIDLFKAQPQQIKENIEKLIEKNVIKRSDADRTCYEYIA